MTMHHARCMEFLSQFDFEIKHMKGKENIVSNTLNRKNKLWHVTTIQHLEIKIEGKNAKCDEHYLQIKEALQ